MSMAFASASASLSRDVRFAQRYAFAVLKFLNE
jgi:hypothetical protein